MLTRDLRRAISGLLLMALASPALASEAGEPDIFAGGIGNAIVTLIVFAVVVFVLGKWCWPPLVRVLNEREQTIRESLEDAKRERDEAERVLEKYTRQLEQARVEASAIIDTGRRNAEDVARRVQDQARQEAAQMVERAKREIRLAAADAQKDVYDLAAELAVDVAGRIVRKKFSAADHKELVAESLDRMRAAEAEMN